MGYTTEEINLAKHRFVADSKKLNGMLAKRILHNMNILGIKEYAVKGICGAVEEVIYAGRCADTITRITFNDEAYYTPSGHRQDEELLGVIEVIPTSSLIELDEQIEKEVSTFSNSVRAVKDVITMGLEGLHIEEEVKDQLAINIVNNKKSVEILKGLK